MYRLIDKIHLLTATTSYPVTNESTSGIFIKRLNKSLTNNINITVVTPAGLSPQTKKHKDKIRLFSFRYAPWAWQTLAHMPGGMPAAIKHRGWTIILLIPFMISFFISLLWNVRKKDIIHAHWSFAGALAGMVDKLSSTPVLTTLHGSDIARANESTMYKWLLFCCIKLNQKIVTVSNSLENQAKILFPWAGDKITTISNGVEESLLAILPHSNRTNECIRISTVCSLIPLKGVDKILRAIAQYKGKERIQLIIIGNGPEHNKLLKLTNDLNLSKRVIFTGMLPASDVQESWSSTDIFILASSREGRPSVVLESMAAAVPVIASDIDANRELIHSGQNGLLFDLTKTSSLVEKINELATDPVLRRSMGLAGRNTIVSRKLLWTETAKQYQNLMDKLLRIEKE